MNELLFINSLLLLLYLEFTVLKYFLVQNAQQNIDLRNSLELKEKLLTERDAKYSRNLYFLIMFVIFTLYFVNIQDFGIEERSSTTDTDPSARGDRFVKTSGEF